MTQFLHGNYSRWPAHCPVGVVEPVWNEPEFSIVFDYVHKVIRVNAVRIHDKNMGFANFHCCLGSKLRSHRSTNIAQVSGLGLEAINCLISEALAFASLHGQRRPLHIINAEPRAGVLPALYPTLLNLPAGRSRRAALAC
jgi:hypothetical protein